MTSRTNPQGPKPSRNRVMPFVVVIAGRVVFQAETLSAAAAWRDGHGMGSIFERVIESRKAVRA